MPTRLFIGLEVDQPHLVRTQDLHFHVCRWLELESVEHRAPQKPFAISPLARLSDGSVGFEVGVFEDSLTERLIVGVGRDGARSMAFGKTTGRIARPNGAEVVAHASWCELVERSRDSYVWQINALSPTFWRQGNADVCEPRAGSIVMGLAQRWKCWSPVTLDVAARGSGNPRGRCELARLRVVDEQSEVETVEMPWRRRTRRGFVGPVVMAADEGNAAERARVDALLRFAEFAGVGSMTPFGFGVVEVQRLS